MQKSSVEAIVCALNEAGVRYLIVGGMAVVAHGYMRFTLTWTWSSIWGKITFEGPCRQLTVFSLDSPRHLRTEVDLFVEAPFDFDTAYAEASAMELAPGLSATFVSYDELLRLKNHAGRPKDLDDVARLKALREGPNGE